MEKGFTLSEVIILFVIFITVAILVIPLSVEDTINSKNITKWQHSQYSFSSIAIDIMNTKNYFTKKQIQQTDFENALTKIFPLKNKVEYKIKYLNGEVPDEKYTFKEIYTTNYGATIAFKWFDDTNISGEDKINGILMYDVNGKRGPNVWGKDIFGMNIYNNKIEPFGKNEDRITMESDCSKQGNGLYCSAYYLKEVK